MMNNAQLAAASFDDIVFDGRNKGYGAYELRGLYQRHVSRALAIGATIFALLVMFPVVAAYFREDIRLVKPRTIPAQPMTPPPLTPDKVVTPPPPPPVTTTPPPPPIAVVRFVPMEVTKDEKVTKEVPEIKDLEGKQIGTVNTAGADATTTLEPVPLVEGPKELGDLVPDKPYFSVEQMPELPGGGGLPAIVAAIQKAVRYPSRAMSAGVEGRVFVSFVVNAQGEVVDVKVIKGLGSGLDEETMRAINTLPRFIPGKQNGREVSVSYSVPITFKIQ